MNHTEHTARTTSRRTGSVATLRALFYADGRGTPSRRPGLFAVALAAILASLLALSASSALATAGHLYEQSFGPDGTEASEFQAPGAVAVDESTGDIYVADLAAGTVSKFDEAGTPVDFSTLGTNELGGFAFFQGEGCSQITVSPVSHDFYVTDNVTGAVKAYQQDGEPADFTAGPGVGTNEIGGFEELCGVAVDSHGDIYASSFTDEAVEIFAPEGEAITSFDVTKPTNVAVDSSGTVYVAPFHTTGRPVTKFVPSEYPPTEATAYAEGEAVDPEPVFAIAVDPVTNDLYLDQGDRIVQFDEGGAEVAEFATAGPGQISSSEGIAINGDTAAVYLADGGSSQVEIFSGVNPPVATTGSASAVSEEGATLNGTADPNGTELSECKFEYGATTSYEEVVPCVASAAEIGSESEPVPVHAQIADLRSGATYHFRLVIANPVSNGPVGGADATFTTFGPPVVAAEFSSGVTQTEAVLGAELNPKGNATTYHFQFVDAADFEADGFAGPGTITTPESASIGEDFTAHLVTAPISGLSSATIYHFRVVAVSAAGTEPGPDQEVETLNSCGMNDGRCLELVSRADKGPLAGPGMLVAAGQQIQFQAAAQGSALAHTVASGYPEATAGDAALYLARRGSGGWVSEQLTPPTQKPPLAAGSPGANSLFKVLSPDLDCGVVSSLASLAPGAPAAVVEAGGANLYLRDTVTGSYLPITNLPPVGPPSRREVEGVAFGAGEYQVVGMSPNCRRVIFRTFYRYPGILSVGTAKFQTYEWDRGTLRNVALIPGPGGVGEPVPAEAVPGAADESSSQGLGAMEAKNYWRAVSADASRSIFTAVSRFGTDSGKRAIFLRDAGTAPATDVSQSEETATPNDGNSHYWIASAAGSRVFFTARYGLATKGLEGPGHPSSSTGLASCVLKGSSSGEGCDLYEYDADASAGERLTDLSPDIADAKGAGVVGLLAASEDGSYVYFAARGRLGGEGRNEAENLGTNTYNVYLAHAGTIQFVGSLGQAEALQGNALVNSRTWTSHATTDGAKLVFESAVGVPGAVRMVYLFSAADGSTVCVSCRHDGRAPFSEHSLTPLVSAGQMNPENEIVQPTVLTDNGRLYFYSFDPLATGAVEGDRNLYQWQHGQVSLIATEPAGALRGDGNPTYSFFGGASADGSDVYFATPQRLLGAALGEGWNVYDARAGGGFLEPAPPAPCDATAEGACNPSGAGPPSQAAPATSNFTGPGNPPVKHHKKKHHKKKHHKKKHHKRQHNKGAGKTRRSNSDRRAAK